MVSMLIAVLAYKGNFTLMMVVVAATETCRNMFRFYKNFLISLYSAHCCNNYTVRIVATIFGYITHSIKTQGVNKHVKLLQGVYYRSIVLKVLRGPRAANSFFEVACG
jgi:hypothetical protein